MIGQQTMIFFLMAVTLVVTPLISFNLVGSNFNFLPLAKATSLVDGNNTASSSSGSSGFQVLPDLAPPAISDGSLRVEKLLGGLQRPTSMAFLDNDDVIILQKDGAVRYVSNGVLQPNPILNVAVRTESERGLLGVAIANGSGTTRTVLLYYTQQDGEQTKNRIYAYDWSGSGNLNNPRLILDMPALPGPNHNGGKMKIGPDGMLYAVKGDLNRNGMLQNHKDGPAPDDTSVIVRVNPLDGSPADGNPFLSLSQSNNAYANLSKYYAYGIRNSFGFDFDPLTGTLWDAEDGPTGYDEINVVKPGFNSGWDRIMGPVSRQFISGKSVNDLVQFQGSHYADPVFSFRQSLGITDVEFLNSKKLGEKYENNIFVGDINNGNLYFFKLNGDRTGVDVSGNPGLQDLVADTPEELSTVTLAKGFPEGITDIKTGPDGYLYILTFGGNLYRIVPNTGGGPSTTASSTATPLTTAP
jgi:glucose/arabinose dehydrogenase